MEYVNGDFAKKNLDLLKVIKVIHNKWWFHGISWGFIGI